jgi:hypothetical protein
MPINGGSKRRGHNIKHLIKLSFWASGPHIVVFTTERWIKKMKMRRRDRFLEESKKIRNKFLSFCKRKRRWELSSISQFYDFIWTKASALNQMRWTAANAARCVHVMDDEKIQSGCFSHYNHWWASIATDDTLLMITTGEGHIIESYLVTFIEIKEIIMRFL